MDTLSTITGVPTIDVLLGWTGFTFVVMATPGPSVAFIVARGVALGRRAALDTVVGNTAGALVQVIIVAAGLTPLLERSTTTYDTIRLGGAAYLIVLGVRSLRGGDEPDLSAEGAGEHAAVSGHRGRHMWEGFVVGITNPKLALFLAAAVPQFIDIDGVQGTANQIAVLGAIFAAMALVVDGAWATAAGVARGWFGDSARRLRQLRWAGGVAMIAVGLLAAAG